MVVVELYSPLPFPSLGLGRIYGLVPDWRQKRAWWRCRRGVNLGDIPVSCFRVAALKLVVVTLSDVFEL